MNVSRAGVLVELHHLRHGAVEEGPVVRDEDETSAAVGHHVLEACQPVEIEVVRRFVEKGDVEASQKDGGQRGPCPLASGKGRSGQGRRWRREADLIERRGEASLEVARSKRLVPGQGGRVAVLGIRSLRTEQRRRRAELGLSVGETGASQQRCRAPSRRAPRCAPATDIRRSPWAGRPGLDLPWAR